MEFFRPKPKPSTLRSPNDRPNPNPFSTLLSHLSNFPLNPTTLKSHLHSAVQNLLNNLPKPQSQPQPLQFQIERTRTPPRPLPFARVSSGGGGAHRFDVAMSPATIEERLAGVPVYALSNAAEEFVLVSGARTGKSLGLFCFKEEDAEALLEQMRSMDQDMRGGSRVVAVALNKVVQLKVDGVAFRLIPDPSQVANAIKEKEKVGELVGDFPGVPVFQSKSLVLRSENKRYRPVFFRKEDLDESLRRASNDQGRLNPALRRGDIQVSVLEEIVTALKENSASKWDDVVFIPPGFKVSTSITDERPVARS